MVLACAWSAGHSGSIIFLVNPILCMNYLDWSVLVGTILFIVVYGVWKTRGNKTMESYLKGDNSMKWWMIGVSIMATQASAITFLSTPGQAYHDGMGFVQFYFGLPIYASILPTTGSTSRAVLKAVTSHTHSIKDILLLQLSFSRLNRKKMYF